MSIVMDMNRKYLRKTKVLPGVVKYIYLSMIFFLFMKLIEVSSYSYWICALCRIQNNSNINFLNICENVKNETFNHGDSLTNSKRV